jgi:hypothetical protein
VLLVSIAGVLGACEARQKNAADAGGTGTPAPSSAMDPLGGFGRMMPGEWKMTAAAGTSMYDTWHQGPGNHSFRVMTHGESAAHDPWRELQVVYWHPGRRQVRLLGIGPYEHSVFEGSVTFGDERAEAELDLYQTRANRKILRRWIFTGPDTCRVALLESVGDAGFQPLVECEYTRSVTLTPPIEPTGASTQPPARLAAFEPLLGRSWETSEPPTGAWADGRALRLEVEWVPYAEGIYARTFALPAHGRTDSPQHVLDTYIYYHTGAKALRTLSLSASGGVYEGDVKVLDDGSVRFAITADAGTGVASYEALLEFGPGHGLRQRVWDVGDAGRTPKLDASFEPHRQ